MMNEELKSSEGKCKFCQTPLEHRFVDVITPGNRDQTTRIIDNGHDQDVLLPTYVCANCFLVQVDTSYVLPVLERAYVSSFGSNWLTDIRIFADNVFEYFEITDRELTATLINRSTGLLQGVRDNSFTFGTNGLLAFIDMYGKADTITCHDELAHVHDINDFVSGLQLFLKPTGVISMEFLHLLPIMEGNPVNSTDATCFPYLSFTTVDTILKKHDLVIFDVGNNSSREWLRISVKHASDVTKPISNRVTALRGQERSLGMSSLQCYNSFKSKSQNSSHVKEELYFLSRQ